LAKLSELISASGDDEPASLLARCWYAAWNSLDPGTLADLHTHFSLEQVASYRAFDDAQRNQLVLFKLHPLPGNRVRNDSDQDLTKVLPDGKIDVPID
jgi:hypothetical protein